MSFHPRHPMSTIARLLLGVGFLVTGLNFFFRFMPEPSEPMPAQDFMAALIASGYVMIVVKVVEVAAGALLLANRFVPLALALLAPILIAILGFHIKLAPHGMALPMLFVALELVLAWSYRAAFAPMLRARVEPARPLDADYTELRAADAR